MAVAAEGVLRPAEKGRKVVVVAAAGLLLHCGRAEVVAEAEAHLLNLRLRVLAAAAVEAGEGQRQMRLELWLAAVVVELAMLVLLLAPPIAAAPAGVVVACVRLLVPGLVPAEAPSSPFPLGLALALAPRRACRQSL